MIMRGSTNLATRPFRNERLPWLLTGLLVAAALALSLLHGRLIEGLLSGDEANTVRAVREDEARIEFLETGIAAEPPLKVEGVERLRLLAFKELVDRRVFPWRRLLAELEKSLSDDVRLDRIAPAPARGRRGMLIDLTGVARTKDAAFSLAEALDASAAFSDASLKSLSQVDAGTEFALEVVFDPDALSPPPAIATQPEAVSASPVPGKPGVGGTP